MKDKLDGADTSVQEHLGQPEADQADLALPEPAPVAVEAPREPAEAEKPFDLADAIAPPEEAGASEGAPAAAQADDADVALHTPDVELPDNEIAIAEPAAQQEPAVEQIAAQAEPAFDPDLHRLDEAAPTEPDIPTEPEPPRDEPPVEEPSLEEFSIEQLLLEEPPRVEEPAPPVPLHERIPLVQPNEELHAKSALTVPVFEARAPEPELEPPPPPDAPEPPPPAAIDTSTAVEAAPAARQSPVPITPYELIEAAPSPPVVLQPSQSLREFLGPLVRRIVRAAFIAGVALTVFILSLIVAYRWVNPPMSTLMLGQWLTGTRITQRWVPIERMSPYLYRAVITSEDGRFCFHRGVDWSELEAAIERARDGIPRGGSTISMQVVKNLFLWPSKSYVRKALEIPLTYAIELAWPKRRILEIYLNIAEWGPGIFGAEAASRYHFGKPAALLNASQAALLAVSLPNPRERKAGRPGPGTLRLAATFQQRMQAGAGNAACIRP